MKQQYSHNLSSSCENTIHIFPAIIAAFFITMAIMTTLVPIDVDVVRDGFGASPIAMFIGRILLSLPSKEMALPGICIAFCVFQLIKRFISDTEVRYHIDVPVALLVLLFGFSMTFGSMLESSDMPLSEMLDGMSQLLKITASMMSWSALFYMGISLLLIYASRQSNNMSTTETARKETSSSSILAKVLRFTPLIIAIAWLPMLIASYPGIFMGDTPPQIQMFFGMENWITNTVVPMSPDVLITQHHPVIHTLLIGLCMIIGHAITGSYEIGYFVYTTFQWAFCIFTLSYAISYLGKCRVDNRLRMFLLVLVIVFPWFSYTSLLGTKDTIFSCIVLLFALRMHALISGDTMRWFDIASISALGLLVSLLRNGTIVAVLIPILIIGVIAIREHKSRKSEPTVNTRHNISLTAVGIMLTSIVLPYLLISNVVFPTMQFTPGSQREVLSIPIQQTASIVKYHSDELTDDDVKAIDAVLSYDKMAEKYDDGSSDPVKGTWNKRATKEDVNTFLKTWLSLITRYPMTCIEATMRNYYGILYPSKHDLLEYSMAYSDRKIEQEPTLTAELGISIKRTEWQQTLRNVLDGFFSAAQDAPIMSMLMTSAVWVWGLFLSMLIACRMRKLSVLCLIPTFILVLISMIGPCNASYYFRYLFPVMYTLPFIIPLLFSKNKPMYALMNMHGQ